MDNEDIHRIAWVRALCATGATYGIRSGPSSPQGGGQGHRGLPPSDAGSNEALVPQDPKSWPTP
jgi:hypothetical protein